MLSFTCKNSARRIDATLQPAASYVRRTSGRTDHDRQRTARQYSTPSKRSQSPATATVATRMTDLPPFLPTGSKDPQPLSTNSSIGAFLQQRVPFTILPPPLPDDRTSSLNTFYFPNSYSQDLVAIIDTCLNRCYDVPRARNVFEAMRISNSGEYLLNTAMFNKFLVAYAKMAARHELHRDAWLHEAWALFDSMGSADGMVKPNAETYATMLLLWKRHDPGSDADMPSEVSSRSPEELLRMVMASEIPLTSLVPACGSITAGEQETDEMVRIISRTVASMGYPKIVHELGRAVEQIDAPVDNVPAIRPVVRLRPRGEVETEVQLADDGTIKEMVPDGDAKEEVFEMPYNLRTLRDSLGELNLSHRAVGDDLWARQQLLEQSVYDVAVERLKHEHEMLEKINIPTGIQDKSLRALMWEWHQKLEKRLQDDITVLVQEESQPGNRTLGSNMLLGSFVSLLSPSKLSLIVILELINMAGTGGMGVDGIKIARALITVGRAVEDEYQAELARNMKYKKPVQHTRHSPSQADLFSPTEYGKLYERRIEARDTEREYQLGSWTQHIRLKIGSFLVDCLMDVATVERHTTDRRTGQEYSENQPAFVHAYEYIRGHKLGVIKLNPAVMERLTRDNVRETIHPRQLPMLTKPRPWVGVHNGGYLTSNTAAMRYKQAIEQYVYLKEASEQGKLELIYAGLDVLGSTPWQINKQIFDVVVKVWNTGERFLKISPVGYDQPEPVPPADLETNPRAKIVHMAAMKDWSHGKANCHSDRCSINYKLEIARAFIGDTFYFPHNMDFRGRAYPVPPHLNHIGDDLSRGLLKFAEAKPLGESGLRWLKIHLANLFGFDKASFSERVEFTMTHMDDIYDSAEKPLDGRGWWKKADDPWQCLATCVELRDALESPDPLKFESSLPVHQDGTCNGLQHYAALGGDGQGAKQVNLDITDRPSDVYTYVADMLDEIIARDVANGVPEARIVQGKVTRRVVKQTVMTTVYGVTYIGARDQIEKQIRNKIPVEQRWKASAYLARRTLAAIGDLFSGAKAIQNWLTVTAKIIAKSIPDERLRDSTEYDAPARKRGRDSKVSSDRISKEQMSTVIWTTALGLPIVQPYRKVKRRQVMTKIQSVYISDPNAPAQVNSVKQSSAFPPNFVHSLDATHMMLTALECRTEGVTFASVHDSYWTHAASIDHMSAFIRSTFIELHSSNVLQRLEAEFRARYANYKIPLRDIWECSLIQRVSEAGESPVPAEAPKKRRRRANPLTEAGLDDVEGLSGADMDADMDADMSWLDWDEDGDMDEDMDEDGDTDGDASADVTPNSEKQVHDGLSKKLGRKIEVSKIRVKGGNSKKYARFVLLTDVIPPLPKKGTFDVNKIKDSLYFFS